MPMAKRSNQKAKGKAKDKLNESSNRKLKVDVDDAEYSGNDSSSSSSEDEETLMKFIKDLGGSKEDLQLINRKDLKGKSKSNNTDNDEIDPALQGELATFIKSLDYKAAGIEPPKINAKTIKQGGKQEAKSKEKSTKESSNGILPKLPAENISSSSLMQNQHGFIVAPSPKWSNVTLPDIMHGNEKLLSEFEMKELAIRAEKLLQNETEKYQKVTQSGKAGSAPGMLSTSDARFVAELLSPGARGGTLSDRIAALTLLAQTSPLHNIASIETLLGMARKKGRDESGRATMALVDWFRSDHGLPNRKLRYFRDNSIIAQIAVQIQSSNSKERSEAESHLIVTAFENRLKVLYFEFIKVLEIQSHDTVPHIRKQAISCISLLLKDKAEQEQNLLSLLVNKLGDADRSVSSKASTQLLTILNVHPAMKNVITREICNLVMQIPTKKSNGINAHAQYYGVLTLNQTMLSNGDEEVANQLVKLYFDLFESLLGKTSEVQEIKKQTKNRWRNRGKGKKNEVPAVEDDTNTKIMAAILTGIRRAVPFSNVESSIFDKHLDTLFRIMYSSTFNISIQALQLVQQICSTGQTDGKISALRDRSYRALYASLLDSRLAKSSKQAMYLNMLFKAMKSDENEPRTQAFVKRLLQIINQAEPPFVCGALFLLGELFIAKPGLRAMLKDNEDQGVERFRDVDRDDDDDENDKKKENQASAKSYDGTKRDAQYANAENSCLWEFLPLLSHFHPSVVQCAKQLISEERISTTADLTLYTLSHFLDRFVYRNPKQNVAISKGASLMQPALHANNSLEKNVMKLRGRGVTQDEFVNSIEFWKKRPNEVSADQLFFHKYFNLRHKDGFPEEKQNESAAESEEESDVNSKDEESEINEEDITKAMKKSMPHVFPGDLDAMDEENEDDSEEQLDISESSDDEELAALLRDEDDEDSEELESDTIDEIYDDEEEQPKILKRKLKIDQDSDSDTATKPLSKSQQRRAQRKKQKQLPTFATAEDYAHLLGDSDEEEEN